MKKTLMIAMLVAALALAFAGIASANGGPHGGYTATTDACAGCHRAHTATGPNLLVTTDTNALCLTCHGGGATGAQTNVIYGVWEATAGDNGGTGGTSGTPLNGGGFTYYNTDATTSTHDYTGATLAFGNGVARGSTAAITPGLSCASCHDPHGTDGYRLLRSGPTTTGDDYDSAIGAKDYTAVAWTNTSMSTFCASCHSAYHETAANVGNSSAAQTTTGNYTHRVDMVWNDDTSTNVTSASFGLNNPETAGYDGDPGNGDEIPLAGDIAVCSTCHFSHGSSAVSDGDGDGTNYGSDGPAGDTALLRLDGRGVCQACHQK